MHSSQPVLTPFPRNNLESCKFSGKMTFYRRTALNYVEHMKNNDDHRQDQSDMAGVQRPKSQSTVDNRIYAQMARNMIQS